MTDSIERKLQSDVRGEVRFDAMSRRLYATDASLYAVMPRGVVVPLDREDMEAAVRILLENKTPILMRGGGTSLAGQTVNDAVVVDTPRSTAIGCWTWTSPAIGLAFSRGSCWTI